MKPPTDEVGKPDRASGVVARPAGGPANGVSGAAREAKPKPPGFGHPGSIDPGAIPRMQPHMQREAVLLLMEMGKNALWVAQGSGLGPMEVMHIIDGKRPLFEVELPGFDGGAA